MMSYRTTDFDWKLKLNVFIRSCQVFRFVRLLVWLARWLDHSAAASPLSYLLNSISIQRVSVSICGCGCCCGCEEWYKWLYKRNYNNLINSNWGGIDLGNLLRLNWIGLIEFARLVSCEFACDSHYLPESSHQRSSSHWTKYLVSHTIREQINETNRLLKCCLSPSLCNPMKNCAKCPRW